MDRQHVCSSRPWQLIKVFGYSRKWCLLSAEPCVLNGTEPSDQKDPETVHWSTLPSPQSCPAEHRMLVLLVPAHLHGDLQLVLQQQGQQLVHLVEVEKQEQVIWEG